jgi:alpha-tubulin suppressor-like RCC1 family protein
VNRALAMVCALVAGCALDANYDGTTFECGAGASCPTGYSCLADRCVPDAPPPPTCATAVGTGFNHACAIRNDGTAWCWGQNTSGQLGDGTTIDRTSPVAVVATGLPKLSAIAGGQAHTCAIGNDHSVWCWGANESGELGNGTMSDNHTPVKVTGITTAAALAIGYRHACVMDAAGAVSCWGDSFFGELGNGSLGQSNASNTPVPVQLAATAKAISAKGAETCVAETTGAVECWGANDQGQLGNQVTDGKSAPLPVKMVLPTDNAVGVAVGDQFACALTQDGAVFCAGRNEVNEIGPGPDDHSAKVRQIPLAVTAQALFAGDRFACAVDPEGKPWCWGATDNFELPAGGDGSPRAFPVRIDYPDVKLASAGEQFMCVQSSDGLRCGGYNGYGQLGDGARTSQPAPLAVHIAPVTAVAAGASFTCATLADQTAMCWGQNDTGQLGDGTFVGQPSPVAVTGVSGVLKLVTGHQHACALLESGNVKCWGNNGSGQLGDGTEISRSEPALVIVDTVSQAPLANVVDLAVGVAHSCALIKDGTMKCWGSNGGGQLGTGAVSGNMDLPVGVVLPMAGPTGITQISAGDGFTCAVDGNHQPWCWGHNDTSKLGEGPSADSVDHVVTPTQVINLKGVAIDQVGALTAFACGHAATGDVWCWGYNNDGELGTGSTNYFVDTPGKLNGLAASKIAVGEVHACAITSDGHVTCWGGDYLGQVGQALYNSYPSSTSVAGLANVTDIAAGTGHTCAVTGDGKLVCWGDDRDGELGDGISFDREPVAPLLACPK